MSDVERISAAEFHHFVMRIQAARIQGMLDARHILFSHTAAEGYRILDRKIAAMTEELTTALVADAQAERK